MPVKESKTMKNSKNFKSVELNSKSRRIHLDGLQMLDNVY